MKKSILNLGKTLNKVEQKKVNGGMISLLTCESICKNAKRGTRCYFPYQGACDGRGGVVYY